jgi:hypothetical protein
VIEYALRRDSLRGAALKYTHQLLIKASYGGLDRDELDAAHHLKQVLLKGIN